MKSSFSRFGYIVAFLFLIIFFGCKKQNENVVDPAPNYLSSGLYKDSIPDEALDYLSTLPIPEDTAEPVINGERASEIAKRDTGHKYHFYRTASNIKESEQKKVFINRILDQARYLCTPFNLARPEEGLNAPSQDHLAYVYGRWDETVRNIPASGSCRDKKLFGLDCSGLLYNCLRSCNEDFDIESLRDPQSLTYWTGYLRNRENWNKAFSTGNFTALEVNELSNLTPVSEMEDGDIIFWPRHVGIYKQGLIYNSFGSDEYPKCTLNIKRGAKPLRFSSMIQSPPNGWGKNYIILRIKLKNDCGKVTDIDGNVYETVRIGDQCWFKTNLKTTRFRNGDLIPVVSNPLQWIQTKTPAMDYPNSLPVNTAKFGNTYNAIAAVDPRGLCPEGWHVPTEPEWSKLQNFLTPNSGGKCMTQDLWCWPFSSPFATRLTNETGLTLLPGNFKYLGGGGDWFLRINPNNPTQYSTNPYADNANYEGYLWTTTKAGFVDQNGDMNYYMVQYKPYILYGSPNNELGRTTIAETAAMGCRCVKD